MLEGSLAEQIHVQWGRIEIMWQEIKKLVLMKEYL